MDDRDHRREQWHDIDVKLNKTAIVTPNHKPLPLIYEMRYEMAWRPYVPMGREKGTYPKGAFHVMRDYRQRNPSIGHKHMQIYANRPTNECMICKFCSGNKDTKLDYYAFYPSGEIFTWFDPAWLNGFIVGDPRQHIQPEGSPFVIKWICEACYNRYLVHAEDRRNEYETRWERHKFVFEHSPPNRYMIDRRVLNSYWQDPFAKTKLPDRRIARRRHTDTGITLAMRMDDHVSRIVST